MLITELIVFGCAIMAAGALAGYASGLFGIGGGVVLVPIFILIYGFFGPVYTAAHMAVGTSLAIIIPNAIMAALKHYQLGNLDMAVFKRWVAGLLPGVVAGGVLMFFISGFILKLLFLGLLLLSMASLFSSSKEESDNQAVATSYRLGALRISGSFAIAALSVLLGIGGGAFTVPYCRRMIRLPIKEAIAISSFSSVFIGIGGTILAILTGLIHPYDTLSYSLGYVNIISVLLVMPFSIWLAPKGAEMATRMDERNSHRLFMVLLLACMAVLLGHMFYVG